MKCADLESLLCDYVDGALSASERATVELHLDTCSACRELVNDSRTALEFMQTASEVEPPPALVNGILFEVRAGKSAPVRRKGGAKSWVGRLLEPILQPKFAMGMAMTILSLSMLARFAGIPIRQLKPSDLEPAKLWVNLEDKAARTWDRAKKYYESMRMVYEIQQTLRDWTETDQSQAVQQNQGAQTPATNRSNDGMEGPIPTKPQAENEKNGKNGRVTK